MSYLVPNESGILVPDTTVSASPRNVSRRGILSTMGAMGASMALPASVGGLSLLAAGAAHAATTPIGTRKLSVLISSRKPTLSSTEYTYNDFWYRAKNASGNPEVNAYTRKKTVYTSPTTRTVEEYIYRGRSAQNSSNLITFNYAGTPVCTIPNSDLTTPGSGCRRLNPSGTENTVLFTITGWVQEATVATARLGTAAAEFFYIRYRRLSDNHIGYRFFRRDAITGGILATVLVHYTGASGSTLEALDTIINGFAEILTARNAIIATGILSGAATIVGVSIGMTHQFTNSTILATSAGCLASLITIGLCYQSYSSYGEKLTRVRTTMGTFASSMVDDDIDCV